MMYRNQNGLDSSEEVQKIIFHLVKCITDEYDLDAQEAGFTYIISPKIVLVVVQTSPYFNYGDNPLFLDPWSYLGYFTFPKLDRLWPIT